MSQTKSFCFYFFALIGAFVGLLTATCYADTTQRVIVIDTDDSPGNTYIDVVQADDGTLESLVYEASSSLTLTFSLSQLQSQTEVLKQTSGRNVIQLKLDPSFDPVKGGYVIVQFLNNGITGNYKDFRILISASGNTITCTSDPDSSDPQSDGNDYTSVFNKLYMWKNTFLGKEVGIDHVTPSLVPATDVIDGPAPLPSP
jgi:hypothetical protein